MHRKPILLTLMSTEQPMQEPEDLTPSSDSASSDVAAAKPRRTRKPKAIEEGASASDVTAETPPAPKVARKRAAKVDVAVVEVDAGAVSVDAAEASVAVKPKRAPRKRVAAEAADTPAVPAVEAAGDGVLSLAPEVASDVAAPSS